MNNEQKKVRDNPNEGSGCIYLQVQKICYKEQKIMQLTCVFIVITTN